MSLLVIVPSAILSEVTEESARSEVWMELSIIESELMVSVKLRDRVVTLFEVVTVRKLTPEVMEGVLNWLMRLDIV